MFRVREPTSKFLGLGSNETAKIIAKGTVLYPVLNPALSSKNLDVEKLTASTNSNALNQVTVVRPH